MIPLAEHIANWNTSNKRNKKFAHLKSPRTYGGLYDAVQCTASYLDRQGIKVGDRLIISSNQAFPVAAIFWTCLCKGIIAVLIDPEIGPKRAAELFQISQPQFIFCDEENINNWGLNQIDIHHTIIGTSAPKRSRLLSKMLRKTRTEPKTSTATAANWWNIIEQKSEASPLTVYQPKPEDPAYLLFTSGSTATPKAVQISYLALWSNLATLGDIYQAGHKSKILNLLTIYHTDGVIQGPILAGFLNASWYHPFEFSVADLPRLFDTFYKYSITHFITVPTMLNFMQQFSEGFEESFDYDEFKYIITSSAPFEPELWQSLETKFNVRIINCYGLTETVVGASYAGPSNETHRIGSIGHPQDCIFLIVDEQGREVSNGETGELLIKGDNLLSTYYNNPEATQAAFNADGFFKTGDLVRQDTDGYFFIAGRSKNLIISGGINIQPETINAVLNTHPDILEAACVGIEDQLFGELLVAAVVPQAGANLSSTELAEFARQELEEAKIPRRFVFLKELPKTGSGKIKYGDLKRLLSQQNEQAQETAGDQHLESQILSTAATVFKVDINSLDFKTASTLTVDGWDSLGHLSFVTHLEKVFSIRFTTKEIMKITSLAGAHEIITKKQ